MANVVNHDNTTTNHTEVLTEYHWGIETFVGLRYDTMVKSVCQARYLGGGSVGDWLQGYRKDSRT